MDIVLIIVFGFMAVMILLFLPIILMMNKEVERKRVIFLDNLKSRGYEVVKSKYSIEARKDTPGAAITLKISQFASGRHGPHYYRIRMYSQSNFPQSFRIAKRAFLSRILKINKGDLHQDLPLFTVNADVSQQLLTMMRDTGIIFLLQRLFTDVQNPYFFRNYVSVRDNILRTQIVIYRDDEFALEKIGQIGQLLRDLTATH